MNHYIFKAHQQQHFEWESAHSTAMLKLAMVRVIPKVQSNLIYHRRQVYIPHNYMKYTRAPESRRSATSSVPDIWSLGNTTKNIDLSERDDQPSIFLAPDQSPEDWEWLEILQALCSSKTSLGLPSKPFQYTALCQQWQFPIPYLKGDASSARSRSWSIYQMYCWEAFHPIRGSAFAATNFMI